MEAYYYIDLLACVVLEFQLSKDSFRKGEGDISPGDLTAVMEVLITKNQDVFLANPITFRITPLTVQQALDNGVIDTVPDEIGPLDRRSPNRAGMNISNNKAVLNLFL